MSNRKQIVVFIILLVVYATSAFLTYTFFIESLAASLDTVLPDTGVPGPLLGLANAGIVLVVYGLLGLAGYWFARRLGLPGIFSPDGNWRRWVGLPALFGLACGVALVLGDALFAPFNGFGPMIHPAFPVSVLASLSAGIGEEIAFRGFIFGLWAVLLNWITRQTSHQKLILWIANGIAALAFGAGHLGSVMYMTDAATLGDLNTVLVAEIFLLNGLVGLVAGERYIRDGLVAAAGVHFWTDIVFHVIWGLVG